MELPRKKKVDYEALQSAFMRIPGMPIQAARDLLDIGLYEVYELSGRSPESLYSELQALKDDITEERIYPLRLAVYFAETAEPDPQKLHPEAWRNAS